MSARTKKTIYAFLFVGIFCVKMLITCSPIFVSNFFNKDAYLEVALQLEIESKSSTKGGETALDFFAKDYIRPIDNLFIAPALPANTDLLGIYDTARHIIAYYPSIPTPPPNS